MRVVVVDVDTEHTLELAAVARLGRGTELTHPTRHVSMHGVIPAFPSQHASVAVNVAGAPIAVKACVPSGRKAWRAGNLGRGTRRRERTGRLPLVTADEVSRT